MRAMTVGDIPTWLLTLAAVVAGWYTHRIYKIESGRDQERADERRAEQASRIAAWIEMRQGIPPAQRDQMRPFSEQYPGHYCVLRNASDLPVYNVMLSYRFRRSDGSEDLPGADDPLRPVLPPGEQPLKLGWDVLGRWEQPHDVHYISMQVRLVFTDASRRAWCREFDGRLVDRGPATAWDTPPR